MCNYTTTHKLSVPDLQWYKNSNPFNTAQTGSIAEIISKIVTLSDNSVTVISELFIANTRSEDAGTYTCRSTSGEAESNSIEVKVSKGKCTYYSNILASRQWATKNLIFF